MTICLVLKMTVCLENLICPAGFAVFVFYVHSIAEETAQKCHTAFRCRKAGNPEIHQVFRYNTGLSETRGFTVTDYLSEDSAFCLFLYYESNEYKIIKKEFYRGTVGSSERK